MLWNTDEFCERPKPVLPFSQSPEDSGLVRFTRYNMTLAKLLEIPQTPAAGEVPPEDELTH